MDLAPCQRIHQMFQKPSLKLQDRKKDDSDVATGMNYGVASSSSWSQSIGNPKTGIAENKRTLKCVH